MEAKAANKGARYGIPRLAATRAVPERLTPFGLEPKRPDLGAFVHFFLDDRRFERVWRNMERSVESLKKFAGALTPDFSVRRDMPLAEQIWNVYRGMKIGETMQEAGIATIPSATWSDERSWEFCFDGLPEGASSRCRALESAGIPWRFVSFDRGARNCFGA